jgi:hypothetical protein
MRTPVETVASMFSEPPDASSRGLRRDIERRRRFPFGSSAISHLNNPHSAANRTYPRATARPQPCWASRPDDRSNGERTCSVPNDRTTALAHRKGGPSVVRSSDPSAVRSRHSDPLTRLIERRDARKGSPPTATRAQDRGRSLDAIALLWPVRDWPSFPGPPTHSATVEQQGDTSWKRRQYRRRESSMA